MTTTSLRGLQLPWSISGDDARFKRILIALLLVYLVAALPIVLIKLPELTRAEKEQLPPQLARVMLEKQELPVKPIEQPKPQDITKDEPAQEQKKPPEKKMEEKAPVKPVAKTALPISPQAVKNAGQTNSEAVAQAREKAANSGLMQLKDDLLDMRESLQTATVEAAATNVASDTAAPAQVDRSMITSGASKASGGINTAAYSRDTGVTALSGRASTKVKSELADASKKAAGATAVGGGNSDGAGGAARSEEEVRKVMEQHKGAIFNIYNKALRDDATLQGKVVVKMVIDPDGRIVDATIVSSALSNTELETKLLQRIKLITFSASKVMRTTLNYSFDFLPQ